MLPRAEELTWRRILASRPAAAPQCEVVKDTDRMISFRVQSHRPWFLVPPVSWLIRPRLVRIVRLDQMGAEIWRLCDGSRTLEAIVDRFAAANGLTFHEARVSVMHYIHLLMERGVLVVGMP